MPIACRHFRKERLQVSSEEYQLVRRFCQNATQYKNKKESLASGAILAD